MIHEKLYSEAKNLINSNPDIELNDGGENGRTPLLITINQNNIEFTDFLINKGANVNYETYTLPLIEATETTANRLDFTQGKDIDIRIVQLLLDHNADEEKILQSGENALMVLNRYFGFDNFKDFIKYYINQPFVKHF